MRKKLLFIFLIFFIALLQVSFLGVFTGVGGAPHLLLVFTLILAFRGWEKESYRSAFWGGFFLDWLSLAPFLGLTSLSLVVILILWRGARRWVAPCWPLFLLSVLVSSFLLRALFSYPWTFWWLVPTLWAAAGDVFVAAFSLSPLSVLFRYLFEEEYWQLDFRNRL